MLKRLLSALMGAIMLGAPALVYAQVQVPVVRDTTGRPIPSTAVITVDASGNYVAPGSASGGATAARQDTGNASLATIASQTSGLATQSTLASILATLGTGTGAQQSQGNAASASSDLGNPLKIGGLATVGTPAGTTTGNRIDAWFGSRGEFVIGGVASTGADGVNNSSQLRYLTAASSSAAGILGTAPFVFNGASWDRQRGDTFGTYSVSVPSTSALSAITPSVSASAAATSLILKASAGNYYDGYCKAAATAGNCLLVNSATVPAAGALTASTVLECVPVAAQGVGGWNYPSMPRRASAGVVMLFSSSTDCNTYTASATAYIHGSVQ